MDIQAEAALMLQANALHTLQSTLLASSEPPPATPAEQSAVILQLSTAAKSLMEAGGHSANS